MATKENKTKEPSKTKTTSFSNPAGTKGNAEPTETKASSALETGHGAVAPVHTPPAIVGGHTNGIEGEILASDLKLVRLNLVNPMSPLATEHNFPFGSVVVGKTAKLVPSFEVPFIFAALFVKLRFQQKLPYSSKEKPMIFDKLSEVIGAGGTIDYSKEAVAQLRFYDRLAHFALAVRCPDNAGEDLRMLLDQRAPDGSDWGVVAFTCSGQAFRSFGSNIVTAGQGRLRDNLSRGLWTAKSVKKSNEDGTWAQLESTFAGSAQDPDMIAFLARLAGHDFASDAELNSEAAEG